MMLNPAGQRPQQRREKYTDFDQFRDLDRRILVL
jgi:hypothetical protein